MNMKDQTAIAFTEALDALVNYAIVNGNILTTEEIKEHFKDIIDDESKLVAVYAYLKENQITVNGMSEQESAISSNMALQVAKETQASDENAQDNETSEITASTDTVTSEAEKKFIDMYLSEMKEFDTIEKEDIQKMAEEFAAGNETLRDDLITANLELVSIIAKDFEGKGVTKGDLIQEGNIGLIEGLSTYMGGDFFAHITVAIKNAISFAIDDEINSSRISNHMVQYANRLDEVSRDLSTKLGHEPSLTDLAKFMDMSEDEVRQIMKESLNALNADNAE